MKNNSGWNSSPVLDPNERLLFARGTLSVPSPISKEEFLRSAVSPLQPTGKVGTQLTSSGEVLLHPKPKVV